MNNTALAKYRLATRELLQTGLAQFKDEQPNEYRVVAAHAQQGAHFSITSALSPAGLDEIRIALVMPDGECVGLLQFEANADSVI